MSSDEHNEIGDTKPFRGFNLLIAESASMLRTAIRSTFVDLGFDVTAAPDQRNDLRECYLETDPDLMVMDIHFATNSVLSLMHDIRFGQIGKRPYICSIAMTNAPDQSSIRHALRAGFDDVLLKPLTIKRLTKHVRQLGNRDRHFVVMQGYIGPDRRKGGTEESSSARHLFRVPNTISHAPTNADDVRLLTEAIKNTAQAKWSDRARPVLGQILDIAEALNADLAQRDRSDEVSDLTARLGISIEQLDAALETQDDQHLPDIVAAISDTTEHLKSVKSDDLKGEVDLLSDLATVIRHVLDHDKVDT